jgi:imidazolonepropionase-like amidohydrolase
MRVRFKVTVLVGSILPILAAMSCQHPDGVSRNLLEYKPTGPLAIVHVRLFDSETAATRDGQTVLILSGRIEAVGSDATVTVPAKSEVIDGTGQTLLPGLVDMHAHLAPMSGPRYVASGVTTVRDMGSPMAGLLELKRRWESGQEIGPHIMMAGPIQNKGKGVRVDTELEAKAAIDQYATAGYAQLKIHGSTYTPDFVAFLVKTAHSRGLRVSGHVPFGMKAEQFVNAGVDEIQHLNFVMENFLAGNVTGEAAAESGSKLDTSSPQVSRFIALLKEKHVVIDPTMNVFEDKYGSSAVYYHAMKLMLKRLYYEGVTLVAGTDAPAKPGSSLHHELEIWVGADIPPGKVLQAATLGAARVMNAESDWGSIRAGMRADLLLTDGDPTQDISNIRRVRTVVKDGIVFKPKYRPDCFGSTCEVAPLSLDLGLDKPARFQPQQYMPVENASRVWICEEWKQPSTADPTPAHFSEKILAAISVSLDVRNRQLFLRYGGYRQAKAERPGNR